MRLNILKWRLTCK